MPGQPVQPFGDLRPDGGPIAFVPGCVAGWPALCPAARPVLCSAVCPVLCSALCRGLCWGSAASSAAEPANDTASSPNGSAAAAANSRLPAGGPRNDSPTVRLTCWLPLALGRSSGGTSAGSTDWAALLEITSALPRPKPATASTPMPAWRATMRTASTATTTAWTAWADLMSAARSQRSTMAPAGSESSSQGR